MPESTVSAARPSSSSAAARAARPAAPRHAEVQRPLFAQRDLALERGAQLPVERRIARLVNSRSRRDARRSRACRAGTRCCCPSPHRGVRPAPGRCRPDSQTPRRRPASGAPAIPSAPTPSGTRRRTSPTNGPRFLPNRAPHQFLMVHAVHPAGIEAAAESVISSA